MEIVAVESTNLFIGSEESPRQVVRIVVRGTAAGIERAGPRQHRGSGRFEPPSRSCLGPLGDREEARLEVGVVVDPSAAPRELVDGVVVVEDDSGTSACRSSSRSRSPAGGCT